MRLQRTLVVLLAVTLSALAAYTLVGNKRAYGRVLFTVDGSHGLHVSDIPVIGLWLVGMVACVALLRAPTD